MSSRPSPPIQPDPKSRLYRAQAVPGHTMAAISFPPIAPHVLPPSHVASNPRPSIPPPSHLQPLFIPPSPRMQLKHSDFSLHHRSLNSVQSPYSEAPQPQSHSREQGAVPLGRLLHTSPYTPSTSISPLSPSYPQQTFDSLLYREIPHETVYLHSSRDHERSHVYSSYQHQQNSPTTHTSSSSTPISFATAPAQIERSMARQQKAPDM